MSLLVFIVPEFPEMLPAEDVVYKQKRHAKQFGMHPAL